MAWTLSPVVVFVFANNGQALPVSGDPVEIPDLVGSSQSFDQVLVVRNDDELKVLLTGPLVHQIHQGLSQRNNVCIVQVRRRFVQAEKKGENNFDISNPILTFEVLLEKWSNRDRLHFIQFFDNADNSTPGPL